jgi:thiamine kinase-like enzyme
MLGDKKNLDSFNPKYVDGQAVLNWKSYFEKIDWDLLINESRPTFIHGDLQFDNIIFDSISKKFTLIDWRYDFSGLGMYGDLYYDFAKLLGGIRLDYSQIKKNNFNYTRINPEEACFTIPSAPHATELEMVLEEFIWDAGYDFSRVTNLVPLIYLNMAPLHDSPFREILWCLFLLGSRNSIE